MKKYVAPKVTRQQLERVHDSEYIDYIFNLSPDKGTITLDLDTWMCPNTLKAALYAAGAVVLGVDLVLSDEITNQEITGAFCNIRPPGHHAEKRKAMGFCFFNNIAVGVAHAIKQYHIERVAIVDFDAHHGNGTEEIFKDQSNVLYSSSFEHPFYPFSGVNTHRTNIINIPLPAGTDGKLFRKKTQELWFLTIEQFKPEIIFFSAGFDASKNDFMSNLLFSIEDYAWITKEIMKIAKRVCKGRVVSSLEGGYALETLGLCVAAHIKEL